MSTGLWRDADLRRKLEKEARTEWPHCKGEREMHVKIMKNRLIKMSTALWQNVDLRQNHGKLEPTDRHETRTRANLVKTSEKMTPGNELLHITANNNQRAPWALQVLLGPGDPMMSKSYFLQGIIGGTG